ncbi:MAG TPA: SCO family protein [Fimbriimonadaceae bacterium]|nr:SCO family protein [Fimbriimonadaceae bacterium]
MKYLLLALVALSCLAGAQDWAPDAQAPAQPAIDRTKVRVVQNLGGQVPMDDSFKDQTGQTVTIGQILGSRPALVLPIFYRCQGVCSVEFNELLQALPQLNQRVGKDFNVIVLSIDPQEGTDLAAEKYAEVFSTAPKLKGTEAGWHVLTGSLGSIRKLTDKLGFYYTYDAKNDVINHPSGIMFLTSSGEISSYILSPTFGTDRLSEDINVANASKLGVKSTDIFLGCIHCDPITGHRSIVIGRFLSLAALATVLGILGMLATFSIKSRLSKGA